MPLEWTDLPERGRRARAVETESNRGEILQNWTQLIQVLQCVRQPRTGHLMYETEGIAPKADYLLYCNFVATSDAGAPPTDIRETDRYIDPAGLEYRVEYVADEAGLGDHLKIYLARILPVGD